MAQKRGPRLRGQRLLDNAPCQAAVNLGSSALLFPRHRALLIQHRPDRHAKGSPSGRAGERSETERLDEGQLDRKPLTFGHSETGDAVCLYIICPMTAA